MFELTRKEKIEILIVVDSVMIIFANIIAHFFMKPFIHNDLDFLVIATITMVIMYLIFGTIFKVFSRINRYLNLKEIKAIFFALTLTSLFTMGGLILFQDDRLSRRFGFFTYILTMLLIMGVRLLWRMYVEYHNREVKDPSIVKRTLIVGAGEGGRILINSFLGSKTAGDINVVGFVDDDPNKQKTYLTGEKVLGKIADLPKLVDEYNIDMVTIAIPSLTRKALQNIFELLRDKKVMVNTMPSMEALASGRVNISHLTEIDVIDLLGREEVKLDVDSIKDKLTDKTILITGAGGSIGSEICRQVTQFNPARLIMLGHGENSIYQIHGEMLTRFKDKSTEFIPVIADIQDRKRIFEIMEKYKPDTVYHAAAHKHVPMMEYNPREAVKNNVFGTKNVAEASKASHVEHFVMISTDKANNPPNVMGSTKRMAEMIVTGLNGSGTTKFSAVRFGNVLGSRGSVIPLFKKQLAQGGPLTVTDFRMTRYFMTIPEASRLVIQAGVLAKGGEIFVLDMGESVKILDLAKNMIRLSGYSEDEIEIIETGIRPGEKLYEELLLDKERKEEKVYDKIFVGNIKGYSIQKVMDFVDHLPKDDHELAKEVVCFANASNK